MTSMIDLDELFVDHETDEEYDDEDRDRDLDSLLAEIGERLESVDDVSNCKVPPEASFQKIRSADKLRLFEFFRSQVLSGSMNIASESLPRPGQNIQLDILLNQMKKDRKYARPIWTEFRKLAIDGPPVKIETAIDELIAKFNSDIDTSNVIAAALKRWIQRNECYDPYIPHIAQVADILRDLTSNGNGQMAARVTHFIQQFSTSLSGATEKTINARDLRMHIALEESSLQFATELNNALPENVRARHAFLVDLDDCLFDKFQEQMKDKSSNINFVTALSAEKVDENTSGSVQVIYFIAGWLLRQIYNSATQGDKANVHAFVSHNKLSVPQQSLPRKRIDEIQVQDGAFYETSHLFYRFVLTMEALYVTNLTAKAAFRYKGRLFPVLKNEVILKSMLLQQQFERCIPESLNDKDRRHVTEKCFQVSVKKYGTMRAADALRKIKDIKSGRKNARKANLSTRTAVATTCL